MKAKKRMLSFAIIISTAIFIASIINGINNSYAQWLPYTESYFYGNPYGFWNQPYYAWNQSLNYNYGYPGFGINGYGGYWNQPYSEYILNLYNPFSYFSGITGYGGYFAGSLYIWPSYGGTYIFSDNPWGPSPYLNSPFGHMNFGQDWITPGPGPLQGSGLFYLQPGGTYYNPITGISFIT